MLKRSHPLLICRRVKEQWLLRPLVVSTRHAFCPKHLLPPTHTSSPLTMPRHLAPCAHPEPSTNEHEDTQGKQLRLLSTPALGFFPSNPPTSCFRPACKLCPKASLSISVFLWGVGKEASSSFLFYRAETHRAGCGIHPSKCKGEIGRILREALVTYPYRYCLSECLPFFCFVR